ncbi:MAG: helix-turn-helix domain-containing protein [Phycisphaerae bacterium]
MSLGEIIRKRRDELDMTQDEVAFKAHISKPYLSNIETSRTRNPPSDEVIAALERTLRFGKGELKAFADSLRTPGGIIQEHEKLKAENEKLRAILKQFMAGAGAEKPAPGDIAKYLQPPGDANVLTAGALVPIINRVTAGYPQDFTDLDYPRGVADEYIRCPDVHDPQAFAARVIGDSMQPAYREGDIVIFSPNTPPASGDDCFVRLEGGEGTTFKRYYQDDENTIRLQPLNSKFPSQTYPREKVTGLWPAVFKVERVKAL